MVEALEQEDLERAYKGALQALSLTQQLTVKACKAENLDALIFLILNDTYHVFPYDRAMLFQLDEGKAHLLGVSGQATYSTRSELLNRIQAMAVSLSGEEAARVVAAKDFPNNEEDWTFLQQQKETTVFWAPFRLEDGSRIGLWFERWADPESKSIFEGNSKLLTEFLLPGYAAAWSRFGWRSKAHRWLSLFSGKRLLYAMLAVVALSFAIRLDMRIVAPCEVVARDPYVMSAPLDGIIEKVHVEPGQHVDKGKVLYAYEKSVAEQEYKIAQAELEIVKAEQSRLANGDDKQKTLLIAGLSSRMKQAEMRVQSAEERLAMLEEHAPIAGVVSIENPDNWSGKPVKTGEKILTLSDPKRTHLKIWIPEKDNIAFNMSIPIKVFLDPAPATSLKAKLTYIAQEISLADGKTPSFVAAAEWQENPDGAKLGLKGNAILYGERVSLFYYVLRKPINSLRVFFGI